METLISITLVSKNNVNNGFYLYMGVVRKGGKYYRASIPLQNKPCKLADITEYTITSEIKPEFYQANNINH